MKAVFLSFIIKAGKHLVIRTLFRKIEIELILSTCQIEITKSIKFN